MKSEEKELLEKIEEFKKELTAELKGSDEIVGLEDELKELEELEEKFKKGELSALANRRYKKVSARVAKINQLLADIKKVEDLEAAKSLLEELPKKKASERTESIKSITDALQNADKQDKAELAKAIGVEEKDLDAAKTKEDLEKEIAKLKSDLETLRKYNNYTSDVESQIKDKEALLAKVDNYLKFQFDEKEIKKDLNTLANSKTKKADKEAIVDKYLGLINELEAILLKALNEKAEKNKNIAKAKKESKNIKEKFSAWWEKYNKLVIGLVGTGLLVATIAVNAKSCTNEKTNTNNNPSNDPKDPTSNSTTENTHVIELRNQLISLGYNELYAAQYAAIPGFDINNLEYYELTQEKYQIPMETAVDYVNRAQEIQKTNFFEGASLSDIIDVVSAIDNKDLHTTNNANLSQYFNVFANDIKIKIENGTLTEEDINKYDALRFLAKEKTDLGDFLSEFSSLMKNVVAHPTDAEAKNQLFKYIATFALSAGGYSNTDENIPLEQPYNENAQVKNEFDWFNAYNLIINPQSQIYMFIDSENNTYYMLFDIMESALQSPTFEEVCAQSRKLD